MDPVLTEAVEDKGYFEDEKLLSHFPPRHHKKVLAMLQLITTVLAYDQYGRVICHGKVIPQSSIVDLLKYELHNNRPTWMQGDVVATINAYLTLDALRVRSKRKKH